MIQTQKPWLEESPWDAVLKVNQAHCQEKQVHYAPHPQRFEPTRAFWEQSFPKTMSLKDALDVCRKAQEMAPFVFFNANTFTTVGKTLLEPNLKLFPPPEAQIVRSTVSHYIAGRVRQSELVQVLSHFEDLWKTTTTARIPAHHPPALQPRLVSAPPRLTA